MTLPHPRRLSALAIAFLPAVVTLVAVACDTGGSSTSPNVVTINKVTTDSATVVVGGVSKPITVKVVRGAGLPVAGQTLRWFVDSGGGTMADTISTTDAAGETTVAYRSGTLVDTAFVSAIAVTDNIAIGRVSYTLFQAADAAQLVSAHAGNGAATLPGSTMLLTAKVSDRFGNGYSGFTVNWTANGNATVSAPTSTTDSTGLASVTLTPGAAPGTYTAQATVPGIGSVTFTVTVI
jgi:adhesin/invasin